MKPATLQKITQLLASLQKRVTETAEQGKKNKEDIQVIFNTGVAHDGPTIVELKEQISVLNENSIYRYNDMVVNVRDSSEQIAASLAKVKAENDDREMRQTARDQNNVQSIVNLKDSTQTAFDEVKKDVQKLLDIDEGAKKRLNRLEYFMNDLVDRAKNVVTLNFQPQGSDSTLPVGHEWVNKKLAGVYDSLEDVETRIDNLEYMNRVEGTQQLERRIELLEKQIARYEALRKAQLEFAKANGQFLV
jgi:hypothetical protein